MLPTTEENVDIAESKAQEHTDAANIAEVCPICGEPLQRCESKSKVNNEQKYYWRCSKHYYEDYKSKPVLEKCPDCQKGYILRKSGPYGVYYTCSEHGCGAKYGFDDKTGKFYQKKTNVNSKNFGKKHFQH